MQAIPGTKAAQNGLAYLRKHQHSGGGFALGGSGAVNSQSTAWAVQGLIAVGADPAKSTPTAAAPSTTSPRARPATATTATRSPATRPRSG